MLNHYSTMQGFWVQAGWDMWKKTRLIWIFLIKLLHGIISTRALLRSEFRNPCGSQSTTIKRWTWAFIPNFDLQSLRLAASRNWLEMCRWKMKHRPGYPIDSLWFCVWPRLAVWRLLCSRSATLNIVPYNYDQLIYCWEFCKLQYDKI